MRPLLFLFFLVALSAFLDTEAARVNDELVADHTSYFDLQDGKILGADALMLALQEAHFVALGELHNRVRLGELTEALLHELKPLGFSYFAVEVGPHSARRLQQLIRSGKPSVSALYKKYSSGLFDLIPIPFFAGESDLAFLAAADTLGFELWGLDQEFYFSYSFLIDEIARLAGHSISREQQRQQRRLVRRLYWLDRRNQMAEVLGRNFERSCRMRSDRELQDFLTSFSSTDNPDIRQILDAFHTTLEIYCLHEQGNAGNTARIQYFKDNFDRQFGYALGANPEPKVFLKMGSFHMGRWRSPLNSHDIGNHVHQLAQSRQQSSVHIYYLNRVLEGRDVTGRPGWEQSMAFVSVGERARWTLIDLRPLRARVLYGTLGGSDYELRTIMNYDFIIIVPEDEFVGRHW
ncbi:MAG: hypothetical protein EA418_09450 [Wenzhouxiangellaceae bacterium]|nr:MAG: hypothetical protein EA418_09450 [Wenzhouxiangellaceae bacterium]